MYWITTQKKEFDNVRFGQEEKNLFRFLFQTDKFGGKDVTVLMADPGLSEIMEIMAEGLKVDKEQAKEMFLTFFCFHSYCRRAKRESSGPFKLVGGINKDRPNAEDLEQALHFYRGLNKGKP